MRAYLFRGLAGTVFSTGIDRLAVKLRNAGIETSVHSWADRRETEAEAERLFKSGKLGGPVVLIGHSLGANSANLMGHFITSRNIPVRYIATIDPTSSEPGPNGVKADNFRSWDPRARKIKGATQFKRRDLNHIQIDKNEEVHARILSMCLAEQKKPVCVDAVRPNKKRRTFPINYPVNNALGYRIGRLLNGRKTAAGILGLLGLSLFQFPGEILQTSQTIAPSKLYQIGFPFSLALFGWGLLGKMEKWVKSSRYPAR
ncbi:MAG: hypothetical protein ACR2O0_14600 [Rhizobiaceae bacterium]